LLDDLRQVHRFLESRIRKATAGGGVSARLSAGVAAASDRFSDKSDPETNSLAVRSTALKEQIE
jgi:hypothetical protein